MAALNTLTNLVKLNLSFSRLGSASLAGLTALGGLRDLRASACQMHSAHMAHLATAFPMLTYLDVSGSWWAALLPFWGLSPNDGGKKQGSMLIQMLLSNMIS